MKYKALFLDIDGTTVPVSLDAHPSARVIASVAKAQQVVHVCIATGRPLIYAKPVIRELQMKGSRRDDKLLPLHI